MSAPSCGDRPRGLAGQEMTGGEHRRELVCVSREEGEWSQVLGSSTVFVILLVCFGQAGSKLFKWVMNDIALHTFLTLSLQKRKQYC